jgi:nucleoside-diphosphate-sugar epimerase
MRKVLVTGAGGQIGSELTPALRNRYGNDNVIASDNRTNLSQELLEGGPFEVIDCTDAKMLTEVAKKYNIGTIYHLAAILSAVGEKNPQLAWSININGLYNVLEVAREFNIAVFVPSSIAAFGPGTPKVNTPQDTIQRPTTIYGVTKVSGELLCDYYCKRFGIDTRGVRFPGIISYLTPPGGGTTDYAVEIFYEAIKNKHYTCPLKKGTSLDMMYMPDAIKAAINVMEANPEKLVHRNAFNVTAMQLKPEILEESIKVYIPEFTMDYEIDPLKQDIADSWPDSIDDSCAKEEWGWKPDYNLESMTEDMLNKLSIKLLKK